MCCSSPFGHPSIHCLSICCALSIYFAWYLCTKWTDLNETRYKYSSCEWALLNRFWRTEDRGQGHSIVKCTFPCTGILDIHSCPAGRLFSERQRHFCDVTLRLTGCCYYDYYTRCTHKNMQLEQHIWWTFSNVSTVHKSGNVNSISQIIRHSYNRFTYCFWFSKVYLSTEDYTMLLNLLHDKEVGLLWPVYLQLFSIPRPCSIDR